MMLFGTVEGPDLREADKIGFALSECHGDWPALARRAENLKQVCPV